MGRELVEGHSAARLVFERVSAAVGLDVAALCWESDEETLRQTQNAQLALFTCGLAAWEALKADAKDLKPQAMAGHSVGEYAALAAAHVITVEDGARLVRRRGDIMAESGQKRPGTMAAVLGLDREPLEAALKEITDGVAVVANDNCPGQLVISGDVNAVQSATAFLPERGAKRVLPLNVSGAFHSPLMVESAAEMAKTLAEVTFSPGDVPVYSNVTTEPGADWANLLEMQLKSPVRWTESMQNMARDRITTIIECGSGEVLCGMMKRINRDMKCLKVADMATLAEAVGGVQA